MDEYEYIHHNEVMRISEYFLEKYKRAFIALANADSIEDGEKYFESESNQADGRAGYDASL